MLVALIVVPAIVIAVAVVVLLDRVGVLPRLDGDAAGWPSMRSGSGSGFLTSVPKGALLAGGAVMALWILAWLVLLVIGLTVLAG